MKTIAVELESTDFAQTSRIELTASERAGAYLELTKPRITFLIVLTAAAGFVVAPVPQMNYTLFFHSMVGIALLCSGVSTMNQFMERDLDGLMRRTASRPLPTGRLSSIEAFIFGSILTLGAEAYLAFFVNPITALFGLTVIAGYLLLYTPLKTRTTLSTVVGAFPGAMPPLMGWTAASGELGVGAWVLFAILFLWQFPHFLAIAWMYKEDYRRAGIVMLPVVEPEGRITAQQIVIFALMLIPVSLFPKLIGIAGSVYFYGALVLGLAFFYFSLRAAILKTRQEARRLLLASVLYLPLLLILMVVNH